MQKTGCTILFFDDTLEERFLVTPEGSLLVSNLLKKQEGAGDNIKYVKWWDPPKGNSAHLFSVLPVAIFLSSQFLFTHFNTRFSDCMEQRMTDSRRIQTVLCHSGVIFPQGACMFFKDRNRVLQFCFSHIIIYHRAGESRRYFMHDNP